MSKRAVWVWVAAVAVACAAAWLPFQEDAIGSKPAAHRTPAAGQVRVPLVFEANRGQAPTTAEFIARGDGYTAYLLPAGPLFVLRGAEDATSDAHAHRQVQMRFVGARAGIRAAPQAPLPSVSHYLHGDNPARWIRDVPHFARVVYAELYPGIDAVFYDGGGRLEYDLVLAPGAEPRQLRLGFEGAQGLAVDTAGGLVVETGAAPLHLLAPAAYQEIEGERRPVAARYRLEEGGVGFEVAAFDPARPLVIDPVVAYASYLGGSADDSVFAVAYDAAGDLYVAGRSEALDFPVASPFQAANNGDFDAFVTKFDGTSGAIVYSTYLGGSVYDAARAMVVDAGGNAHVVGRTASGDFPRVSNEQFSYGGGQEDGFVAKLDASGGGLVYSTHLGGNGNDSALAVALDGLGRAVVTGTTGSTDLPVTAGPPQAVNAGNDDVFVRRYDGAGTLEFSTYLGGAGAESGEAVATDGGDNIYITGSTTSNEVTFPITAGAYQQSFGGTGDGFVAKIDPTAPSIVYATYLGGADFDGGRGLRVLPSGEAYVVGVTRSADFPVTPAALQPVFGGIADVFVTRLNVNGTGLAFSTFLGGTGWDIAWGAAADSADNIYIVGETSSIDFPLKDPLQVGLLGSRDAFLAKLGATGSPLLSSTYFGGSGMDLGLAVAAAPALNKVAIAGRTQSTDFPLGTPVQGAYGGGLTDGFFVAFDDIGATADLAISLVGTPAPVVVKQPLTYTVTVTNGDAVNPAPGVETRHALPVNGDHLSSVPAQGSCAEADHTVVCRLGTVAPSTSVTVTTTVLPVLPGVLSSSATIARTYITDPDLANNADSEDTIMIDGTRGGAVTLLWLAGLAAFAALCMVARRHPRRAVSRD